MLFYNNKNKRLLNMMIAENKKLQNENALLVKRLDGKRIITPKCYGCKNYVEFSFPSNMLPASLHNGCLLNHMENCPDYEMVVRV